MKCPYYRKINVENHPSGFKSCCEGDRLKSLRVPTLFEETHYCTTLRYPACRVFQARQRPITPQDGPETAAFRI
jgi:hypothetical protein